jgi:membrane protease YdiL (CAAX protease family)
MNKKSDSSSAPVVDLPTFESSQIEKSIFLGVKGTIILGLVYLAVLGSAEAVLQYVNRPGGIIFYVLILFSLVINSTLMGDGSQRSLWLALGLVPLIRIISVAMPIFPEISQTIWYIVVSIPILVGTIMAARILKYSLDDIGLRGSYPFIQILAAPAGLALGALAFLILRPEAWTKEFTVQATISPALVLLVFTGLVEELAFRGVLQRASRALGSWGWVYVAAIYAVLQMGQGSAIFCLYVFGVALLFGFLVKRTGSILGVSLSHGLFNIGLYLIFPYIIK